MSKDFAYMCLLFFLGVGFVFSYLDAAGSMCCTGKSRCNIHSNVLIVLFRSAPVSGKTTGNINAAAGLPASRATITFGIYGALARVLANCALDYTRGKPFGGPMTYIALSLLALAAGWGRVMKGCSLPQSCWLVLADLKKCWYWTRTLVFLAANLDLNLQLYSRQSTGWYSVVWYGIEYMVQQSSVE